MGRFRASSSATETGIEFVGLSFDQSLSNRDFDGLDRRLLSSLHLRRLLRFDPMKNSQPQYYGFSSLLQYKLLHCPNHTLILNIKFKFRSLLK